MRLLFASSNPHKVDEVRAILAPLGITVIDLTSFPGIPEPIEDGETIEDNARIKAIAYAKATGQLCLADDSGLEVDALNGAPGVHSARYAHDELQSQLEAAPDDDRDSDRRKTRVSRKEIDTRNNAKLLRELKNIPPDKRTARFVCAMCLADPDGNILAETRGTFEGLITDQPRGTNGFGYDPLLYLLDLGCTSAELSPEEKNARSHRGEAARKMADVLKSHRSV